MTVNMTPENTRTAMLAFMVKNVAAQKAGYEIMIGLLVLDEKESERLVKRYNTLMEQYTETLFNNLLERMNNVDLDQILGQ